LRPILSICRLYGRVAPCAQSLYRSETDRLCWPLYVYIGYIYIYTAIT
jgi:hypothetical protein